MNKLAPVLAAAGLMAVGSWLHADAPPATQPRDAWQTTAAYLAAAIAGRLDEAAALGEPGKAPSQAKTAKDLQQLKLKQLAVTRGYANAGHALVITDDIADDRNRRGPLVFTLVKADKGWLIRDIDLESAESVKEEIQRFLDKHPDATPQPGLPGQR